MRHPALTRIHAHCPLTQVSLPNLQYFGGYFGYVPVIAIGNRGLNDNRLIWY
jgi:hypothetical protein